MSAFNKGSPGALVHGLRVAPLILMQGSRHPTAAQRTLISDLGGVLFANHWDRVTELLVREVHVPSSMLRAEFARWSLPLDLGEIELADLFERLRSLRKRPISEARFLELVLVDGIVEIQSTRSVYDRLRARPGVRLVALSNIGEEVYGAIVQRFRIDQLFDGAVLSCRTGVAKPDRKAFMYALNAAGCPPSACIFLDDAPANVSAGERLGLRSILYQGPDSLSEVERLLQ